ncbi:MAG: hypothetical protein VKJ02_02335 [Snowella sp.]|nr:hypothetical protein [Snowella sp.]
MPQRFSPKLLGSILWEAGLITPSQIEVALQDQQYYRLPLGEILALHGWIQQETADFFAETWPTIVLASYIQPLGHYLQSAALLNEEQIQQILLEQKQLGVRFGALAVMKGWVKQQTVDYFLENLVPQAKACSDFQPKQMTSPTASSRNKAHSTVKQLKNTTAQRTQEELILPASPHHKNQAKEQTLFFSESTISIEGNLQAFCLGDDNLDENYDLAQALDYHLMFSE